MFSVYLLVSNKTARSYVGMTEKSVDERLKEHNQGCNQWTKQHAPFRVVYYETYYCKQDALRRELFLKSGIGNRVVKALMSEFNQMGL